VTFVTALGLAIALLVAVPYFAHRLRRRRAEERPFAAARMVPPAPPRARRRSRLEDRGLFALRAASVLALALLGASPLVRCSRLSLQREGGASVAMAIVVDDSMSMRATFGSTRSTRFDRAVRGARELLGSAREGDAIAIVLAGAPSRVALAATTDLGAARGVLDTLAQSDRGTDLDGAIAMARALVTQLPQVDRRVVVLSDLADGKPDAPPLGGDSAIPVWIALPELRGDALDCGVLSADRSSSRVRVSLACGQDATAGGREVTLRAGSNILARAPAPSGAGGDVSLTVAADAPSDLVAHLEGADAIAADDEAVVVAAAAAPAVAVIADSADEETVTGGAPVVEQALAALRLDVALRPIPAVPERAADFAGFVGVIADDPPGFTPEQRRALGEFVEQGGEVLIALGPRAAAAPLGATLEPVLTHAVRWGETKAKGAREAGAVAALGDAARSLGDLGARDSATLAPEDAKAFDTLLSWDDGSPLVARRAMGRGGAWIVTLPFAVGSSDLTLRPGFLTILDTWTDEAKALAIPLRIDVGQPWAFAGPSGLTVEGPHGPLAITRDGSAARVAPPLIGAYRVTFAGNVQARVAAPVAAEMDLRPRGISPSAAHGMLGDTHASVDVSWSVALALLALVFAELVVRAERARRPDGAT
jgi:hypothetical protein